MSEKKQGSEIHSIRWSKFSSALSCRLIDPAKPEMGKISKATLDRIILAVQQQLPLNMWKSTGAVSDWFTGIERKQECTFICFDIVEFYPSITKDLLDRALDFASGFTPISQKDKDIIFNSRKSMLFGRGRMDQRGYWAVWRYDGMLRRSRSMWACRHVRTFTSGEGSPCCWQHRPVPGWGIGSSAKVTSSKTDRIKILSRYLLTLVWGLQSRQI